MMSSSSRFTKPRRGYSGRILNWAAKFVKWFFGIIGFFSFLIFVLSFTDIPFYAYYRLGTVNSKFTSTPDVIVLLSGSGMPSPDGLIRAYYGVKAAMKYPQAKIIIAIPYDEADSLQPLKLMAHELTVKGIDSARIQFEPLGFNTRSQAVNIAAMMSGNKQKLSLLIITSPEHMYRAVKTFRKIGFPDVGGIAAFDKPIDPEKAKDKGISRDLRVKSLSLRYNMWSYLHYELFVLREYCAISYYKLKGWI